MDILRQKEEELLDSIEEATPDRMKAMVTPDALSVDASGVILVQRLLAAASESIALRRSDGSLCGTPLLIAFMSPNASVQPRFRAQRENVGWSALLGALVVRCADLTRTLDTLWNDPMNPVSCVKEHIDTGSHSVFFHCYEVSPREAQPFRVWTLGASDCLTIVGRTHQSFHLGLGHAPLQSGQS